MDKRRRLLLATINRKEYIFQEGKGLLKGTYRASSSGIVNTSYIRPYGHRRGHTTIIIGG